ncbi:SigE family RNA polymerase sigma factor [Yinghuangia soli]|uniref:SigE family RNA polymerase sigma factor n=1 Tax=Yinghuangia soli TaxID=2908204 RepID=A0AA41PYS5_9ACTN|nr:SigE family RNA polymerase sigma factor [Yinghuangia soli]MCF2528355.1 SigE family RNA polymerase sigma factor [Yinghuangia soli]
MKRKHDSEFDDFVVGRSAALRRTAYLLCGDWHHAEDLVQTTFAQVYARWHRVRDPNAMNAYARKILVRSYVDTARKRSSTETATGALPDVADAGGGDPDTRVALLAALDRMTPAYRAVLVLRFWEDQSAEQTAVLLNKSPGSVRSSTARGLEQLRAILGDQLADLSHA